MPKMMLRALSYILFMMLSAWLKVLYITTPESSSSSSSAFISLMSMVPVLGYGLPRSGFLTVLSLKPPLFAISTSLSAFSAILFTLVSMSYV